MEQALNAIAALLTSDKCDYMTLNWASLRYQHTAALTLPMPEGLVITHIFSLASLLSRLGIYSKANS
jgi:hypothetical protein